MLKDRLVRWFSRANSERGSCRAADDSVFLATDIGMVRKENQDRVAVIRVTSKTERPFIAIALVDGMGGMNSGAECAAHTLSTFFDGLTRFRNEKPEESLRKAANLANMETYNSFSGRGGATLSALLVTLGHETLALNVGDSRIYSTLKTGRDRAVHRLTVDDSLEEAVGGHGKDLLQFMGMGDGLIPHICAVSEETERLLVTSDGIHFINQECLEEIFLGASELDEVSNLLCTFAKFRGAPDNASVAVCDLHKMIRSFSSNEEPGVELWDPFSALHVMWAVQEPPTPEEQTSVEEVVKETVKGRIAKPKVAARPTKSSKTQKKEKTEPKKSPELIIDVQPDSKAGEGK